VLIFAQQQRWLDSLAIILWKSSCHAKPLCYAQRRWDKDTPDVDLSMEAVVAADAATQWQFLVQLLLAQCHDWDWWQTRRWRWTQHHLLPAWHPPLLDSFHEGVEDANFELGGGCGGSSGCHHPSCHSKHGTGCCAPRLGHRRTNFEDDDIRKDEHRIMVC